MEIKINNKYKISLCMCLLVLSLSFAGCSSRKTTEVPSVGANIAGAEAEPTTNEVTTTTTVETTNTQPEPVNGVEANSKLIKISELTIKPQDGSATEVIGKATNNNKMTLNFDFDVIYLNKDGTPLTVQTIQVCDIKAGETKYFSNKLMDTDISKSTHTIQFGEFFTYTK